MKLFGAHLLLIVERPEITKNFFMWNGRSARRELGQRHPTKKTVFQLMLVWIQSTCLLAFVRNGDNLGKQFARYQQKYKDALSMKGDSGFGLSMEELCVGITLDNKLEKFCPHFWRLHVLYGE